MRYLVKFSFPTESGNAKVADSAFGAKFQEFFKEIKAEAAYLCPVCGKRGGYVVVSFDDASKLGSIVEKFWHWLSADVEVIPVMLPEDLAKIMPEIKADREKWGK